MTGHPANREPFKYTRLSNKSVMSTTICFWLQTKIPFTLNYQLDYYNRNFHSQFHYCLCERHLHAPEHFCSTADPLNVSGELTNGKVQSITTTPRVNKSMFYFTSSSAFVTLSNWSWKPVDKKKELGCLRKCLKNWRTRLGRQCVHLWLG